MNIFQRFGYYLGGFSIGLVILAFFFNGKKTSCSYGPDARVLKNIRIKKMVYSDGIEAKLLENKLDSVAVNYVLRKGDINFSKSDAQKKPCAVYLVEGDYNDQDIELTVENCEEVATVMGFEVVD